jgi:hypothetical protein
MSPGYGSTISNDYDHGPVLAIVLEGAPRSFPQTRDSPSGKVRDVLDTIAHSGREGRRFGAYRIALTLLSTMLLACGESQIPTDVWTADAAALSQERVTQSQVTDLSRSEEETTLKATASFYADPPGECKETLASLEVTEPLHGSGPATVKLTYSVLGSCGDAEGLWYYDLWTSGANPWEVGTVSVDPADVFIHPGLRRASVDVVLPVFDAEANAVVDIRLQAEWEVERSAGDARVVVASLSVSAPYLNPLYLTNPLYPSLEAELTRSATK